MRRQDVGDGDVGEPIQVCSNLIVANVCFNLTVIRMVTREHPAARRTRETTLRTQALPKAVVAKNAPILRCVQHFACHCWSRVYYCDCEERELLHVDDCPYTYGPEYYKAPIMNVALRKTTWKATFLTATLHELPI